MRQIPFETRRPRMRAGRALSIAVLLLVLILLANLTASFALEYAWWSELGQLDAWLNLFLVTWAPLAAGTVIAFAAYWLTHRQALRFAGAQREPHPVYLRLSSLGLLLLGWLTAAATLEGWTIARFIGSRMAGSAPDVFRDPVFHLPLGFYLFDLPFWSSVRSFALAVVVLCALLFWIAARTWQLRYRFNELREFREVDLSLLRLPGGLESRFLRGVLAVVFLFFAARFFLGRYAMVWHEHGFMVGIDWLDAHITLPMQWLLILAALAAAVFAWIGRWRAVGVMVLALPVAWIVPRIVSGLYVKPNEISLETPYIATHIHATRSAFGIENRVTEMEYPTAAHSSLDVNANRTLLNNVRLWDWRPFHDTVTQTQALRPYYVFHDTDVDRYTINGEYRQTLITPRELDISQLRTSGWINPRFIYTHGYGVVLAEVSKISPEGLPVYLIQNMPPQVSTPSLQVTRPELYFSEVTHEPVFVHTSQPEFNYPSGAENVQNRYAGHGGFPVSSIGMRLAAAIHYGDPNIVLTDYLTPDSRMMMRRDILTRVGTLAPFLTWDSDPYVVLTPEGRLVWILDGYTTSNAHPYSRSIELEQGENVNYVRNSVKATLDAYDGTVHFYVFAPDDPIIRSYQAIFPTLFEPERAMPAALRAHARYPEFLFRAQSEIYRAYHMTNPQAFYNREDLWDLARYSSGQEKAAEPVTPTYVIATLPGETNPEFLLMTSFTPLSKENLIGVMLARCDGAHLGDIRVLLLSKQELTLGPMQISARINQDQNISKDLTLWNQQGSQVLRGQMLVLPVEHTFLYVAPIYIQATEARMPQLRKVVLGIGNRLIYANSYEEALAELSQAPNLPQEGVTSAAPAAVTQAAPQTPAQNSDQLTQLRQHWARYRQLLAQGKLAEAGRELEIIGNQLQ